jgi:hypothetical protein
MEEDKMPDKAEAPAEDMPEAGNNKTLPETNNTETADMEVHHHPQLEHKPKPWKEYILEYLMIVLAVITGFFAESLREHMGDRAKEKEYLSLMVSELRYDTAQYNTVHSKIFYLKPLLDSLYINAIQAARFNYVLQGKWNTPINETRVTYVPTLTTIQQLKTSGSFRLIENKNVLKLIMDYEAYVQGVLQMQSSALDGATGKIYATEDEICDEGEFNNVTNRNAQDSAAQYDTPNGLTYNMPFVIKDAVRLNQLANAFVNYKTLTWGYNVRTRKAMEKATSLLQLIHDEYKLKEE